MPFLREFLELKADNLGRCLVLNLILQQASVKTRILSFVMENDHQRFFFLSRTHYAAFPQINYMFNLFPKGNLRNQPFKVR